MGRDGNDGRSGSVRGSRERVLNEMDGDDEGGCGPEMGIESFL